MFFDWPANSELLLESPFVTSNTEVYLMGYPKELRYKENGDKGMIAELPVMTSKLNVYNVWSLKLLNVK